MRRRWPKILAYALLVVGFLWPTPYLTGKGGAGISIGAFMAIACNPQGGIPTTPLTLAWIGLGLFVGAAIGYWRTRKGVQR